MHAESHLIGDHSCPKTENCDKGFHAKERQVLKEKNEAKSQKRRFTTLNVPNFDQKDDVLASNTKRFCHSPHQLDMCTCNEFSSELRSTRIKIEYESVTEQINSSIKDFPSLKHPHRYYAIVKSFKFCEYFKIICVEILSPEEMKGNLLEVQLKDIWYQTELDIGSYLLIIDPLEVENGEYEVNITQGLVIVEPHALISATILSQSLYCTRKSILQDRFRFAKAHFAMTLGIIVHEIFQTSLTKPIKELSSENLLSEFRKEGLPKICADLVAMNKKPNAFEDELQPYLENIVSWMKKFMPSREQHPLENGIIIEGVHDIEDNIWSPTIGVKGKIDVAFKTSQFERKQRRIIPIELKTGMTKESMDHKAQLLLYSLLLSEKTFDGEIPPGIVLYLKDNIMRTIYPKMADLKMILIRRNSMVQPFTRLGLDSLPEPLASTRICEKCQYALTCTLLQKSVDSTSHSIASEQMTEFVAATTNHLSSHYLEYAKKWLKWSILEWETAKQKRKFNNIFVDTPEKREKNKNCLANARLIKCEKLETQKKFLLTFSKTSGDLPHGLFEKGDYVIVSTRSNYALLMGSIVSYEDKFAMIKVDKINLRVKSFYHLDRYESYTTYGQLLGNIVGLMDESPYSKKIRELIIDKRAPIFGTISKEDVIKVKPVIAELESNQVRAIVKCLTSKDYLLIQGLPGSGKTTTIVALVRCLLKLKKSVLITAYTNSAVDNMLLRLKKFVHADQLLRVASDSVHTDIESLTLQAKISAIPNQENIFEKTRRILEETPIVATTCIMTSSNSLFTWRRFDVCIVDEASLALQSCVIKPICLADSFVLVGDSRQLAPLVLNNTAKSEGMAVSLLEHLTNGCAEGAMIMLNKQFRMNKIICGLSSTLFYENKLQCANTNIEDRVLETGFQENFSSILSNNIIIRNLLSEKLEHSVLFIDTKSATHIEFCQDQEINRIGSLSNQGEAKLISKLCDILLESDFPPDEIGIISAYKNQVDVLKKYISNLSIEINTIDQYQGLDKDLIFISMVHTSSEKDDNITEKHLDEKRINVAITRAKKKLILVGCGESMLKHSILSKLLQLIKNSVELSYDLLKDINIMN